LSEKFIERMIKFYLPLFIFLFFLLFPFYWMFITAFKSDAELYNLKLNPFFIHEPTFKNILMLFKATLFNRWMFNTFFVAWRRSFLFRPACWRPMPFNGCVLEALDP